MNAQELYKNLNEEQKKAVQNFEGPVLILAGAGSGKTRVLVYRIAALILEGKAHIENILAVTFTNKAAREMKERTKILLNPYNKSIGYTPWIGTFHSVCAQILRQNLHLMPERTSITIYDQLDQLRLVKKVIQDLNLDEKMYPPKTFRSHINLCKRMAVAPNELHRIPQLSYDSRFENVYREYEKALRAASAFDFESLLLETYYLMKKHPDFLEQLQNQFKYICVDEYQDTNQIQYLLIQKLASKFKNICVVGDEDQSIYGWRGADMNNIMDFEKDFKGCRVFFLEENYRSTQNIVQAASSVISHNQIRKGKTLFTHKNQGENILIKESFDEYDEGKFIAETIFSLCSQGDSGWEDFAILYRTNAQSRCLEDQFRSLRIPYKIVGSVRFYERAEIKDILSYLKLILNIKNNVAFLRVINSPKRGFGKKTLSELQRFAYEKQMSFYETLKYFVDHNKLKGKGQTEATKFIQFIDKMEHQKNTLPLYEFYMMVLRESTYLEVLNKDQSLESQSRITNLQELGNVITQEEQRVEGILDLEFFLEKMSLLSEDDKTQDVSQSVTLMTLHNSKGLEFNTVFIAGMEEGLFPSTQSLSEGNIEEERRLAYVGMTRAQERLILSFACKRKVWGKDQYNPPSCFVKEIPQNLIQYETSVFKNQL